ncbi:MAG TPA: hypothetical protein VFI31_26665 [Pirellulales bacterium]|nr:hypothetical protein [Pirellulales bacterium]
MAAVDLPLTLAALEAAIASVDRRALLAPPRILRRVIKQDRQIATLGLRVPHRKSYLIDADQLLKIVDRDELGLTYDVELSGRLILLARPDAEYLSSLTTGEALIKYWRLLFHARVHRELDRKIADGELNAAAVRQRIERLGDADFEEARLVLRQEELLLPPADDVTVYVEFAAVFLELKFFAPSLLRRCFPSLDEALVGAVLDGDVDAAQLWTETRLPGAPMPSPVADEADDELADESETAELTFTEARPADGAYRRLNRRADRAAGLGNAVRAAILRTRAARFVRPSLANRVRAAAQEDLHRLTERLRAALELSEKDTWRWSQSLVALLSRSVHGFWTREGRTLYDLQKVCVDFEREIYTLDLIGWVLSGGRAPIKRRLPGQREVLMSKHLRVALRRARKARIDDRERRRLVQLLERALAHAETRLRERFRPLLGTALAEVGLRPANLPERVASKKLVEELLDQIVERDFLTMSDLRDGISRNNLKLPDLESARQFFSGDQLLVADQVLGQSLDGVYHRGEAYIRLPQRVSSLAFGTAVGRTLVRYLAIPYGGAYLTIKFIEHLILLITGAESGHASQPNVEPGELSNAAELIPPGVLRLTVFVVGTFLLGLIYVEGFRSACLRACRALYRGGRWLAIDLPAWLVKIPLIRAMLASPIYRFVGRFVVKPLVFTVLVLAAFRSLAQTKTAATTNGVAIFFLVNLLLNSRLGRNAEELITDWIVHNWERFRLRVLGAVVQMVMEFFNHVLDAVDRFLYSVDEWLRFRSGQGRIAIAVKSALGVAWFFVTYVVRFCITLLIEPQVNPVKHFPVVTVSHKILSPMAYTPAVHGLIVPQLKRVMAPVAAEAFYGLAVFALPGVVGFLVWELKENWRLYKANRPRTLQPAAVGHHGETIVRLLRFGFHSGTISKLYMRLRRADRKALWTGNWKNSGKYRQALTSLEHEVRNFVHREFIELLSESQRFRPLHLRLGRVSLGANSIVLEFECPDIADRPLRIGLADQAGWLTGRVIEPGWAANLADAPRQALADALTGLYKMSGVELVYEQIAANVEPQQTFSIVDFGLLVYGAGAQPRNAYQLRDERPLVDGLTVPIVRPDPFDREALVFASWPVPWDLWVEVWDRDQAGGRYTPRLVVGAQLLPQSLERAVS